VWKLVSYTVEEEGRENSLPFGPEPEGFLIYTAEGFVSAQPMKPGRSLFQGHGWQGGTADEYQQAGSGHIAYCGSYAVDEENKTVTHTPSVALVPNLIHKPQPRLITLGGKLLTLRVVIPIAKSASVTSRLEWQRVGANGNHL
jgi:Lipocalin-like domain